MGGLHSQGADREPLLPTQPSSAASDAGSSAAEEGLASPQPAAATSAGQAAPAPACRICLQDDDPDSLEKPCSCSGSMAWAHHSCIQRWIDEKHDKECEVCKQPFQGSYRDPPPRPAPTPLVAQLQVDNADNRIVLLADPDSGAVLARVVVPPGSDLPDGDTFHPWVVHAARGGAAAGLGGETDEEEEEEGGGSNARACHPMLLLLVLACVLGTCAFLASSAEGGGAEGAQASAWFVRAMLLTLWIYLRSARPGPPRRLHHAELERRRRLLAFADLEAGLQRRQPVQQTQQQQAQ